MIGRLSRRCFSAFGSKAEGLAINRISPDGRLFTLAFSEQRGLGFGDLSAKFGPETSFFLDPKSLGPSVSLGGVSAPFQGAKEVKISELFGRSRTQNPRTRVAASGHLHTGLIPLDFSNPLTLGSFALLSHLVQLEGFSTELLKSTVAGNPGAKFLYFCPQVERSRVFGDFARNSGLENLTVFEFDPASPFETLLAMHLMKKCAELLCAEGAHVAILFEGAQEIQKLFLARFKEAPEDLVVKFLRELQSLSKVLERSSITCLVTHKVPPSGPQETLDPLFNELSSLANISLQVPAEPQSLLSLKSGPVGFDLLRNPQFLLQVVSYLYRELKTLLFKIREAVREEKAFEEWKIKREPWEKFKVLDSAYYLQLICQDQFLPIEKQIALVHMTIYSSMTEKINFFDLDPRTLLKLYLDFCEKKKDFLGEKNTFEFINSSLAIHEESQLEEFIEKLDTNFEFFFEEQVRAGRTLPYQKDYLN